MRSRSQPTCGTQVPHGALAGLPAGRHAEPCANSAPARCHSGAARDSNQGAGFVQRRSDPQHDLRIFRE